MKISRFVCACAAALMSLGALAGVAQAKAAPVGMPPQGKIMLGVGGSALNPTQFGRLTGAPHEIHLVTVPWNEERSWDWALRNQFAAAEAGNYRLMVHIGTAHVYTGKEGRSPGEVARGVADAYFLDMSRELNLSGHYIYMRPPGEMNGHWSHWSAFNKNGSRRDADHSTRMYKKAFIRLALISRAGSVSAINKRLAAHGLPPLRTNETYLPRSGRVATVWNPQAEGSPNVRGNAPQDYYPGAAFVDYVANDLYEQNGRAHWAANESLYNRYKAMHPFMMAEYAPWGYDSPTYIAKMFAWAQTHPRTVALIYFNGTSGATFRLSSKPRSLAKYKSLARSWRYRCAGLSAFSAIC